MKLAPTLSQTYQRRHWLLVTNLLENVFFSAILLGWPALVALLKEEGYYAHLCSDAKSPTSSTFLRFGGVNFTTHHFKDGDVVAPPVPWIDHSAHLPNNLGTAYIQSTAECCQWNSTCPAQEKKLNLCFTVGTFLLSALTLPIGIVLDKFGSRWLRMLGGILVGVSCLLFACSSAKSPDILFFACALCGLGGNMVTLTSLQVSNLFGPSRTMALGLLIGSYAAAAITFPVIKVLCTLGIPLKLLFFGLSLMTLGIVVNAWMNLPNAPIPVNLDFSRLIDAKPDARTSGAERETEAANVELQSPESDINVRVTDSREDLIIMPLHRVIFTPLYLWSVIVISVTQLRLLFFVGDLHHLLVKMTQDNSETVDLYIFIFGILQICCLGTTHFITGFVNWQSKKCNILDEDTHLLNPGAPHVAAKHIPLSSAAEKIRGGEDVSPNMLSAQDARHAVPIHATSLPVSPDVISMTQRDPGQISTSNSETFNIRKTSLVHLVGNGGAEKNSANDFTPDTPEEKPQLVKQNSLAQARARDLERKIRKLKDCAIIFFVTSTLTLIFGLLVLIPTLTIQISTFVCYTLIRGFVPCAVGRLYSVAFRPVRHQTLVGLAFLLSALFSVGQHPLFALDTDYLQGDPYWVNVGLLLLSLFSFGLPIHLLLHCKNLEAWSKTVATPPQPVVVKMQYVDAKATGYGAPADV